MQCQGDGEGIGSSMRPINSTMNMAAMLQNVLLT